MKNIAKFDYINKSRAQRAKRNETQRDALQKDETGGKTFECASTSFVPRPLYSSRRLCAAHAFVSPASAYFTPCGNAGKKFILWLPPPLGGGTKQPQWKNTKRFTTLPRWSAVLLPPLSPSLIHSFTQYTPPSHTHADRRPSTQSFSAGSKIVTDGMQICLHSENSNSYSSATCRRIWLFTMRYPRQSNKQQENQGILQNIEKDMHYAH